MTTTTNFALNSPALNSSVTDRTVTLTRRGRLVLLGLPAVLASACLLAVLLLASASLFNTAQASTSGPTGVQAVEVEVKPGDTLWSVAAEVHTGDDIRAVMAQIAEINSLDSSQLQPGEILHVPAD